MNKAYNRTNQNKLNLIYFYFKNFKNDKDSELGF